jgi:hypothetical protein
MRTTVPALLIAVFLVSSGFADDEFQTFVKNYNETVMKNLSLNIAASGQVATELKLHPNAILNWSSLRNGYTGAQMFVWLKDERPMAISGLLHWPRNNRAVQEFINLTSEIVYAELNQKRIWIDNSGDSVKWRPMTETSAPAKTKALRLAQMRQLAGEFTARAIKGLPDYPDNSTWELRLVAQPLYRYQPKSGEATDGAIFSFAIETDPEALLLLESRKDGSGKAAWYFAFARACAWELHGELRKNQVWRVERIYQYPLPQGLGFFQASEDIEYPSGESTEVCVPHE